MSASHLRRVHEVKVDSIKDLAQKVHEDIYKNMEKSKRREKLEYAQDIFDKQLHIIRNFTSWYFTI